MQKRHSEQFHHIRDIAVSSIEKIEDIYRSKGKLTGRADGFLDFDAKTAGLQKSDLILLAARPSMGKTAFAAEYHPECGDSRQCADGGVLSGNEPGAAG